MNKANYDADVGGAEEGDRRSLHQRMGAARSRGPWADFERAGVAEAQGDPGHEVYPISARAARRVEARRPSRWRRRGPTTCKKAGGDPDAIMKELQGRARQVQGGLLSRDRWR